MHRLCIGYPYSNGYSTHWITCRTEGFPGFYRGWVANTLKVVPQNSIRLVAYELLKTLLGIKKAKTDT